MARSRNGKNQEKSHVEEMILDYFVDRMKHRTTQELEEVADGGRKEFRSQDSVPSALADGSEFRLRKRAE